MPPELAVQNSTEENEKKKQMAGHPIAFEPRSSARGTGYAIKFGSRPLYPPSLAASYLVSANVVSLAWLHAPPHVWAAEALLPSGPERPLGWHSPWHWSCSKLEQWTCHGKLLGKRAKLARGSLARSLARVLRRGNFAVRHSRSLLAQRKEAAAFCSAAAACLLACLLAG
jgi:hypothetical protein